MGAGMTAFRPSSLCIGTYAGGGGRGVYDLADDWTLGDADPVAANASFGTYAPRFGLHYLVDERDAGTVGAYRRDAAGWQRLASVETGGAAPCHVALNHAQTALAVANYASGSVSLFVLDANGLPRSPAQVHANSGHGPNAERQEAPHAHWVGFSPDDRWLYQTDLGTDEILAFPVADGALGPARIAHAAPPGSGPRHLLLKRTREYADAARPQRGPVPSARARLDVASRRNGRVDRRASLRQPRGRPALCDQPW
jgi:6-phosphogluconolactonase (cycloisomerase 2 family)